jgi:AcrR family transcriptional regulator
MSDAAEPTLSRRDLRKQIRRSTIVAEARKAFLRDGYAGMSMSGLIATLGGSKATLWSYFPSKEALFAAVLEDAAGAYARDVGEFLRLSDDLGNGLFELCKSLIGKIVSPEPLHLTRLVLAESGRFPEVGKIFYAHAIQPMEASVAVYLNRHMEAGRLRQTAPMAAARILIDLCNAPQARCLWGAESFDDSEIERTAANIAHIFLRAYGPEPTPDLQHDAEGPMGSGEKGAEK